MTLDRRSFLSGAAALLAAPRIAFARAATERRFIFIIQRGAADGLDTVIPEPAAEPAAEPVAAASAPAKPAGADTTSGAKEKLAGYVPKELLESVKDAVSALGSHEDDPRSLSEFLENAARTELARLQQQRNDGRPFPRRARRQLVAGRRPD